MDPRHHLSIFPKPTQLDDINKVKSTKRLRIKPMNIQTTIHDLYLRKLTPQNLENGFSLPILSEDHHLLRRFGATEFIHLNPHSKNKMRLRVVADEIWALLQGRVLFTWRDMRSTSPTHNCQFQLDCREPMLLLVPFGVAFGQETAENPALLLRIMTHVNGEHEGDREISWEREE